MSECPGSQSVMSKSFGYLETCGKNAEYLRRGCTYTPKAVKWAGDLVITEEAMMHQSLMKYFDGVESCEPEHTFPAASGSCGEKTARPDGLQDVKRTSIRDGNGSFLFTVAEGEPEWDIHIAATNDDGCGASMAPQDGGDILFSGDARTQIKSLCGTIEMQSFATPKAFYLDNRKSFPEDEDKGLLVAIQNGLTSAWSVLYSEAGADLSAGLVNAEDISTAFLAALEENGIVPGDVFSFGMI